MKHIFLWLTITLIQLTGKSQNWPIDSLANFTISYDTMAIIFAAKLQASTEILTYNITDDSFKFQDDYNNIQSVRAFHDSMNVTFFKVSGLSGYDFVFVKVSTPKSVRIGSSPNNLILAIRPRSLVTYRLKNFRHNDFGPFISELRAQSGYRKPYLNRPKKFGEYYETDEELDFECLMKAFDSRNPDPKKYPCLRLSYWND